MPSDYLALLWIGFGALAIATLWLTITGAADAFCHRQFLPSPGTEGHRISANNLGILAFCVTAITMLGLLVLTAILPNSYYPRTEHQIVMTSDGQLWDFAQTQNLGDYWNPEVAVAKIPDTGELQLSDLGPLPTDWQERRSASLTTSKGNYSPFWPRAFEHVSQFEMGYQRYWDVYKHRNRLLLYSSERLEAVVTPEGFFDSMQEAKGRFDSVHRQWASGQFASRKSRQNNVGLGDSLFGDANGLYQIDWKNSSIRTVIEKPNEGLAFVLPASDQEAVLWVCSGSEISRHKIKPVNPEDELELRDSEIVARAQSIRLPEVTVEETGKWSFASTPGRASLTADPHRSVVVSETEDGKTLFASNPTFTDPQGRYEIRLADGTVERESDFKFPLRQQAVDFSIAAVAPAIVATFVPMSPQPIDFGLVALLILHSLFALAIAFWLTRVFDLGGLSRGLWLLAGGLLGLGAPLAMVACYPRVIRQRCHHCEAQRRIDRSRCRKCGADWPKPALEGNEIIGVAKVKQALATSMSE